MIQPSSLYAASPPTLSGLTPGLGNAGNAGNAGTTGGVAGLTGTSPTQSLFANPSGGSANPPGGGDITSAITQIMSMLMSIISALISSLQQGGAGAQSPALDTGGAIPSGGLGATGGYGGGGANIPPQLDNSGLTPPTGGPAPTNSGQLIAGIRNKTTDPSQKQRLDTTLAKVAQDPDGAKLLQTAEANGYSIEVGDPTQAGSQDHDADSINGVTIPEQKRIIINPNAPDFDKTVVHELVHAATQSDGNSQTEEGMADVIGYRVSSRIDGQQEPGSEQQIFQNKIKSYPNLNANNDIINSLSKLGISA